MRFRIKRNQPSNCTKCCSVAGCEPMLLQRSTLQSDPLAPHKTLLLLQRDINHRGSDAALIILNPLKI